MRFSQTKLLVVKILLSVSFLPSPCAFTCYDTRPLRLYLYRNLNVPPARSSRTIWYTASSWQSPSSLKWNCRQHLHQSVPNNQGEHEQSGQNTGNDSKNKSNTELALSIDEKDDPILSELEDVVINRQDKVMMNNRSNKMEQFETRIGESNEENYSVVLDIIAVLIISGVVGFGLYSLFAASSTDDLQESSDLLDWKDLVAYTIGETFSSSLMKGLVFLGELTLFRFLDSEFSSNNNHDTKDKEEPKGFVERLFFF
mmetsp:Transcript_18774/g.26473  ORF Transcript_18774/g.26473 Transcript_18774/m.26473 type:complete len:256 (+) Transcript_18774:70-837(+)